MLSSIAKKSLLLYSEFVDKCDLDYQEILKKCGLGELPVQAVIKNIINLEEFYDRENLTNIYNYCLVNINNYELIIQIIKLADEYKADSTLAILIDMLTKKVDENDDNLIEVRSLCAKAISNYKDYSTVTLLLNCMNNKNEHYRVRLACADALGRIGDKYAVQPLINLVEDDEEKSVYLKESATSALGMLGDASAIEPLVAILESKQGFLDKFSFLKEKIVEALGKLNFHNKKVINALKHSLMDSSPIVRINAIEAIMNSEDEDSVELIKPCLNDEDTEVQKNALIALYNLVGRDILDEVIELPIYSETLKTEALDIINEYEEDGEE